MGRKLVSGASGKMGRLFLGGNEICVEDWNIEEIGDEHDTTNTCGAGAAEQEYGVTQLQGSFTFTMDVTLNPFLTPWPNLTVGKKHVSSKFYLHALNGVGLEDGLFYDFTLQVGSGVNVTVPVRGKVTVTLPFKSSGSYTLPTQAAGLSTSGA